MYRRCIMGDSKKGIYVQKQHSSEQEVYHMKNTKEERLDVGRRIYEEELSRYQAAEAFGISEQAAWDYMRLHLDANQLPAKRGTKSSIKASSLQTAPAGIEDLESMAKEQLIQELVKARITEVR